MTPPLNQRLRCVGDPAQLYGIEDLRLSGGKAEGTRAVRLYNAGGVSLTVLPDRGMDLAQLSYRGVNLSFLSTTGLVGAPYFAEEGARGFFRSFYGGLLTTCGLTYMGAACQDEGEALGLHGVISNTPAQEVCPWVEGDEAAPKLHLRGLLRQARVFGEHVRLERHITMDAFESTFSITDRVQNAGFEPVPLMLLYHMNFGYPFLSPALRLHLPSRAVRARDKAAEEGLAHHLQMEWPRDGAGEQVFFHTMEGRDGRVEYLLENPELDTAVAVSYPAAELPWFTQWKCMRSGAYVLGLEPGNCHVLGRDQARRDGSLKWLPPGGEMTIQLQIHLYHGPDAIAAARARLGIEGTEEGLP